MFSYNDGMKLEVDKRKPRKFLKCLEIKQITLSTWCLFSLFISFMIYLIEV